MSQGVFLPPFAAGLDLEGGTRLGPGRRVIRRASDMRGYYRDTAALERLIASGDPTHYDVVDVPVPAEQGQLAACLSTLRSGTVGEECFMTKGHYHAPLDRAEIYLALRGEGLLLMKTIGGQRAVQRLTRGTMAYVPPGWAHRSINVGPEPLVSFCVYGGDAGHEYGDIARTGFPHRVFLRRGRVVVEREGKECADAW